MPTSSNCCNRDGSESDLYYRLATLTLAVPPLRDRPEDLPLLLKHFLSRASAEAGKTPPELEPEATACLMRYGWPGNMRELHNVIQSAVIVCGGGKLRVKDLPSRVAGTATSPKLTIAEAVDRRLSLDRLEREYVRAILGSVNGNKREAAAILQIDRKTLYRKLEEPGPRRAAAASGKDRPGRQGRVEGGTGTPAQSPQPMATDGWVRPNLNLLHASP